MSGRRLRAVSTAAVVGVVVALALAFLALPAAVCGCAGALGAALAGAWTHAETFVLTSTAKAAADAALPETAAPTQVPPPTQAPASLPETETPPQAEAAVPETDTPPQAEAAVPEAPAPTQAPPPPQGHAEATIEALRRELDEARALSELKTHALSNLSHELRTPLTSVRGYCDMLADELHGPLNDEQRNVLEKVSSNTAALLALINNLLDLNKLAAGKMELTRRKVMLAECLESAVDVVEPLMQKKGLALEVHLPERPVAVTGSFDRLRQVLINLMGNAVKFTEHGSIVVTVRTEGREACIDVADTGIGIAPAHLPLVFEEFSQADPTIRRRFGGTGLGLALARRIVEWHDGRITVESELGRGTTFTIHLPILETRARKNS